MEFVSNLSVMYKYYASSLYETYMYICSHIFLNTGMEMDSLLDILVYVYMLRKVCFEYVRSR